MSEERCIGETTDTGAKAKAIKRSNCETPTKNPAPQNHRAVVQEICETFLIWPKRTIIKTMTIVAAI